MTQTLSKTFDEAAELYDAVRPTYPDAVGEAMAAVMPRSGRVLEIGSGTGQATVLLANHGYHVLGLEPGARLAALAAKKLRAFPTVTIEVVSFEGWPLQPGQFDLVMSATAFHWVAPEVRYVKAAQALDEGGHLVLLWNLPPDQDDPVSRDIQRVYERCLPKPPNAPSRPLLAARVQGWAEEIERSGFFGESTVLQFPWSEWYTTERYLRLLETYSDHRPLPEITKRCLYGGIGEVLEQNGGGGRKAVHRRPVPGAEALNHDEERIRFGGHRGGLGETKRLTALG